MTSILKSSQDASVNFVSDELPDGGFFESRFVQRTPDYFIVYLSSHSGCNKSCRFCHLTASKQTTMTPATLDDFVAQAIPVIAHYKQLLLKGMSPANTVHFNFMARGEPLSNMVVVNQSKELFDTLQSLVFDMDLTVKFKISSIVPSDFDLSKIKDIFKDNRAMLYYSLYSMEPEFRKRWVPKAHSPKEVLSAIQMFQKNCDNPIAIHWANIKGENDTSETIEGIVNALNEFNINCKLNFVRYNPFSDAQGIESSEDVINNNYNQIVSNVLNKTSIQYSRIVPRVGFDVKASCGMFISK